MGIYVGPDVGERDGNQVGTNEGGNVGSGIGDDDGEFVGRFDGISVGDTDGAFVGNDDGCADGAAVGFKLVSSILPASRSAQQRTVLFVDVVSHSGASSVCFPFATT